MRSVAPRLPGVEEVTFAEDQPEYVPITVGVIPPEADRPERQSLGGRMLVTRWRFTPAERARLAAGEDLYISQLNFGGGMTPLLVCFREALDDGPPRE